MSAQEKKNKEIILHDDDPYILARVIEFAYTSTYSERSSILDGSWADPPSDFILAVTANFPGQGGVASVVDKQRDQRRSWNEINCEAIKLADKYGMKSLLQYAAGRITNERELSPVIWDLHDRIGRNVIDRHTVLQNLFARLTAERFEEVEGPDLQKWIEDDPGFGYKLAQAQHLIRIYQHCYKCPNKDLDYAAPCTGTWEAH